MSWFEILIIFFGAYCIGGIPLAVAFLFSEDCREYEETFPSNSLYKARFYAFLTSVVLWGPLFLWVVITNVKRLLGK